MRRIFTAIAAALCALAITPSAFAVDPFETQVSAVPETVTLSSATLTTYASYRVTITNNKPNPITGVRLIGTTTVVGSSQTAPLVAAASDPRCMPTNPASILCTFDPLPGNGAFVSFTLTFEAPSNVLSTSINFAWSATFDESGGGGSDGAAGITATALTAPSPDEVTSYLPQSAQDTTVFTGVACDPVNGCAATPTDTWTTTVSVPGASQATTATLVDTVTPVTCAADLLTCSTSTLTIPGTFASLLITLRRDASTIRNGAKIASALVHYSDPTTLGNCGTILVPVDCVYPMAVLACDDTTFGSLPKIGIPCIESRTAWPKKTTPKVQVPAGYEGDWQFRIKAIDNGKYNQ